MRDLLEDKDYKDTLQEMIYQKENKLKKIPSRQRITYQIRDKVEGFIREFIIADNGTLNESALNEEVEKDNISISNMANAILTIRNDRGIPLVSGGEFTEQNSVWIPDILEKRQEEVMIILVNG